MFNSKRDIAALRGDLLCAFLVVRELDEYGKHYSEDARARMVKQAVDALTRTWLDTGASESEIEPALLALLASGRICKARPQEAAE